MIEMHPSLSAVGEFMDEETEIAALAQRYYEEEGRPKDRSLENWARAEREVRARHACMSMASSETPPTAAGLRAEEDMHLGA